MDLQDQLTMAHAMGKIEGLVAGIPQTFNSHDAKDDSRFESLNEKMEVHLQLHSEDMVRTLARERELSKWKWSTVWAIVGTIFGGVVVAGVTVILKAAVT